MMGRPSELGEGCISSQVLARHQSWMKRVRLEPGDGHATVAGTKGERLESGDAVGIRARVRR